MCLRRICVIKRGDKIGNKVYNEDVLVPCGKCPDCKQRRVSEWVFRMREEDKVSSSAFFITLTFDTDHVPLSPNGFMTLDKTVLTKYFKRLRKQELKDGNKEKIKYYAAGEYGSQNNRPHWHVIIFNVRVLENLSRCWGFGFVHVGKVSGDSIAYTLKYIDKDKRIPVHQRDDRVKEYSVCSKGLGQSYLSDNVIQWHKNDITRNYVMQDGYKVPLSRYYREQIYDKDEKEKQRRIIEKEQLIEEEKRVNEIGYDEYLREKGQKEIFKHVKFKKNQKNRNIG